MSRTIADSIFSFVMNEFHRVIENPIIAGVPYLLSMVTAYSTLQAGKLKLSAWKIGIINQVFWLCWILYSHQYGFLLMNATMWYVNIVNLRRWKAADLAGIQGDGDEKEPVEKA